MGGRRAGGGRLPRHPLHRDPRDLRPDSWRLCRVVPERKGGLRRGDRRRLCGAAGHGRLQARGPERRRRLLFLRRHHRRRGRPPPGRRRRPRHALFPGRAGHPALRRVRPGPLPGAFGLARGQGHGRPGTRPQRGVRHAGHPPPHHPHLPLPLPGRGGARPGGLRVSRRPGGAGEEDVPRRREQIRHGPGERPAPPAGDGGARRPPRPARRGPRGEPPGVAGHGPRYRDQRGRLPVRPGGLPRGLHPAPGDDLPPPRGQGAPSGRTSSA